MTPAAVRTVHEGAARAGVPVPRSERRRARRERRRVIGVGVVLLCTLVCVVVLVLDRLHHSRTTPGHGALDSTPMEVHVTDMAA
ncbi:MAG TPA: hypothetical protein VKR22_04855 [Acidimicrobiales bacterium]|nr:hypothetical protein [Acidimicrobiales bacterium]